MSYARLTGAIRVVVAAFVSVAFVFASAPAAFADTILVASSPQDGGETSRAPSQVELRFSDALRPGGNRAIVLGPDGRSYQTGPARIVGNKLIQPLAPLGPSGAYRVDFRVVAADGHTVFETITFTLTKPGPAGGATLPPRRHQFIQVGATALTNAPPWAPWAVGVTALILVSGAVLFGRRVTDGRR